MRTQSREEIWIWSEICHASYNAALLILFCFVLPILSNGIVCVCVCVWCLRLAGA